MPILFCFYLKEFSAILRQFIPEGYRRSRSEHCRSCPKNPPNTYFITVFSSETVNIKKLANLTANTKIKSYWQIALNTKPHSHLLDCIGVADLTAMIFKICLFLLKTVYFYFYLFNYSITLNLAISHQI